MVQGKAFFMIQDSDGSMRKASGEIKVKKSGLIFREPTGKDRMMGWVLLTEYPRDWKAKEKIPAEDIVSYQRKQKGLRCTWELTLTEGRHAELKVSRWGEPELFTAVDYFLMCHVGLPGEGETQKGLHMVQGGRS